VVQVFCFKVQKTVAIMGDVGGAAAAGGGDAEPFLHGKRKRKGGIAWTPWPGHAGFRAEVRYPNDYPQGHLRNRINVAASRRATVEAAKLFMSKDEVRKQAFFFFLPRLIPIILPFCRCRFNCVNTS